MAKASADSGFNLCLPSARQALTFSVQTRDALLTACVLYIVQGTFNWAACEPRPLSDDAIVLRLLILTRQLLSLKPEGPLARKILS